MTILRLDKKEIEMVLEKVEKPIARHVRETRVDEREDLAQEIREKLLLKMIEWDEEPKGIFEFAKCIKGIA